uniref:TTF-type domain-containing protein n=1 Tax=Latimeria chalumnae TaxID=7897 RepID=H3AN58_LATCH
WLHYDETNDIDFCFICIRAYKEHKLSSAFVEKSFISVGCKNWKKAADHERSKCHIEAMDLPQTTRNVGESLSIQHAEQKHENRQCFLKLLSNIQFLCHQGLALRGDGVTHIKSRLSTDKKNGWRKKTDKYTSPDMQNSLIETMANKILQNSLFYSKMADETVDASNKEQLVICLRWVDDSFLPHEDFIGMYEIANTEVPTIFKAIEDMLKRLNLPLNKVRGQYYDMAGAMAESKNGMSTIESRAVYTHCTYALNLVRSDVIKGCKLLQDALETQEITKLIKESPRHDAIFKTIKETLTTSASPGIRILCPTRWTVNADALDSVIANFETLLEIWDEALEHRNVGRIKGVFLYMKKFDFLFGAMLGECLLRHSDNLSKVLQAKTVSAAEGQKMAALTVTALETMRKEEAFGLFWEKIKAKAQELKVNDQELPRRRRPPKHIDDGGALYHLISVEEWYRTISYEALDLIVNCIKTRFNQPGYGVYINLENLLLKVAAGKEYDHELSFVCNFYGSDISPRALRTQLSTLKANLAQQDTSTPSLNTIIDFITANGLSLFCEIVVILKLVLVMPDTNATSERSFSAMRRKTYLRATMTQKRMNNLMVLHIHKGDTDRLNLIDVANELVTGHEHRLSI